MPEKLYTRWLDDRTFIHVEFLTIRGRIVSFVVRLMTQLSDRWINVVRYDTAHGLPHRDILDQHGRVIRKDWLTNTTFEEALTQAKNDLVQNYESYIEKFQAE